MSTSFLPIGPGATSVSYIYFVDLLMNTEGCLPVLDKINNGRETKTTLQKSYVDSQVFMSNDLDVLVLV